jgi:hypothetical protein
MEQVVAAPTEEGERLEAPASCHDEAWEKVRVVSAMEFYNLLISLRTTASPLYINSIIHFFFHQMNY